MSLRLKSPAPAFGAPAIDRASAMTFRLDGVEIPAFDGDTVLSAVLAAGIIGAGHIDGSPLRLGAGLAPRVRPWSDHTGPGVPVHLTPARDGLDLVTIGARTRPLARLAAQFGNRPRKSLDVDFGHLPGGMGLDLPPLRQSARDMVVVGGGIAGMTAALAAAARGQTVMLIEERARLGGDAPLFGNRDGEDRTLDVIASLKERISRTEAISVRLLSRALAAEPDSVTFVFVESEDGPQLLADRVTTQRIVLATGCADRLPIYPGNRLPGIFGLAEAFEMAGAFGIWPGGPSLFSGGTNTLYHIAMLAKDSGAEITRLIDTRPSPHSRFLEFAKATGIPQQPGTRISEVVPERNGLLASTALAWDANNREGHGEFSASTVIQSDGWRPRLSLWAQLGGDLKWRDGDGVPDNCLSFGSVALAGSVVGLMTNTACRQSAENAVARLFGAPEQEIEDIRLADYIESPDAEALVPLPSAEHYAFFSAGRVLAAMPRDSKLKKRGTRSRLVEPVTAGRLDIETIDALIRAGLTPPSSYQSLSQERLVNVETVRAETEQEAIERAKAEAPTPGASDALPDWLVGRFEGTPERVVLAAEDGRHFEAGMSVFADSGTTRVADAIGLVIATREGGALAALADRERVVNDRVHVRDGSRAIGATVVGKPDQ